jgi:hypothetical protein
MQHAAVSLILHPQAVDHTRLTREREPSAMACDRGRIEDNRASNWETVSGRAAVALSASTTRRIPLEARVVLANRPRDN